MFWLATAYLIYSLDTSICSMVIFSSLFEIDGLSCSPSILNIAWTLPSPNSINTFLLEIEFLIDSYSFSLYSQEKSTVKLLESSCQYIVIFLKVMFSLWLLLGCFIVQNFSMISFWSIYRKNLFSSALDSLANYEMLSAVSLKITAYGTFCIVISGMPFLFLRQVFLCSSD